jgi:hypothetical protein
LNFAVRFKETIPPIEECDPWMLFDTAETISEEVTIPGNMVPNPNLRVYGENLREDFILRDTTSTGTATATYTYYDHNNTLTSLYLPDTTRAMTVDGRIVDFPALPVMKDATTYAGPDDIIVKVNGSIVTGLIADLDPLLGYIELYSQGDLTIVEHIQITQDNIDNRHVQLSNWPVDSDEVALNVVHGPPQAPGVDFNVFENVLYLEDPLLLLLVPGDILVVTYSTSALIDKTLEFSYQIGTTGTIEVIDLDRSRVFDSDEVFPGQCYDGYKQTLEIKDPEYVNFLSDYGKGIKHVYLNKGTYQLEEHIFSGPVFETYSAFEDEISSMESFPDALVRVVDPLSQKDPLQILPNYDFLNDPAIRIRKKTVRELLPNRTFRTMELLEALPV